jgi:hypothetical protein
VCCRREGVSGDEDLCHRVYCLFFP